MRRTPDLSQLLLTSADAEDLAHGIVRFETGRPVTFSFMRNTPGAKEQFNFGAQFGQDIEPAGRYMLLRGPENDTLHSPWMGGEVHFENPLVLEHRYYGADGWKARLRDAFKAKGLALSKKLRSLGFDGIVTVMGGEGRQPSYVSEIVDLSSVQEKDQVGMAISVRKSIAHRSGAKRKASGRIGSVPVTEVLAIHEEIYQRVLQAVPRNDRTNLFPGNQTAILREITDPCLSLERALALVVAGFPKTQSNEVSNSQQPWMAWALLQNPAYPLLTLENPSLRTQLIRRFLNAIYAMVEDDARIDGSRSTDWAVLGAGIHFFRDVQATYPDAAIIPLCNTLERYLAEGIRVADREEYIDDYRSRYKGREAFLRRMDMPDIFPLLFNE